MKKQILILAIFTMAIFASTGDVFGQVLTTSEFATAPVPLAVCVGDPQHPKAGVEYNYAFDAAASSATVYRWWATKDPNFVSAIPTIMNQTTDSLKVTTGDLLDAGDSYWAETATESVDITWSADILGRTNYQQGDIGDGTSAAPTSTFVVGWGSDGCTDNIKVWEIDPSPAFTVDITVIDGSPLAPLTYGDATATQCVDEVRAAIYNPLTSVVDYNFGWDTLYYEVVAANFVDSWLPTFFLTGLDGTLQEASIGLASSWANAEAGTFIDNGDITGGTFNGSTALTTGLLDNSGGVSLYVRVVIANNNYETLAASTIGLSVAGEDTNGFDIDDDITCTIPANAVDAADDDETTRTITERPTLQEGVPTIITVGAVITP